MSGLLDGKVVLINGGTQGVGGATARAAVREGAQVVVTGRRLDAGTRFAAELETLGGDVRFVQTDMADPEQARRSVTRTVEEFGRIDGLCNAAGITTRGTLLDTTPELFDTHIAVNLRGPFFAMQAAVADMVERHTAGSIVNILDRRARRPGVPRAVRGGQGRPGRPDPQRRLRAPVGPHPHQRPQHRMDRKRRRNTPSSYATLKRRLSPYAPAVVAPVDGRGVRCPRRAGSGVAGALRRQHPVFGDRYRGGIRARVFQGARL